MQIRDTAVIQERSTGTYPAHDNNQSNNFSREMLAYFWYTRNTYTNSWYMQMLMNVLHVKFVVYGITVSRALLEYKKKYISKVWATLYSWCL